MSDKTYNGWSNYETWLVALWLDNEAGSYDYWREQARRCRLDARHCGQVLRSIWQVGEAAVFNLADQLKDELHDAAPLGEPSLFTDLLKAALDEVDWQDVAEHYLADLDDDPDEPEAEDGR